MTYAQAIAYLDSLIDYERRPLPDQARAWNLDRTRALLEAVGNPHQSMKAIHIAGTKGKGSTGAFVASILRAAGYHAGLYTSPHLVDFRERIRLDGVCIPKRDVGALVARLQPRVEHLRQTLPFPPSFFEVYTAIALRWFADRKVDFAVLETGLGGRLDATNVVTPLVSIITTIGLDHTVELGPTISHIAREKAGIIKPGIPVICAPQRPAAFRQISRAARSLGAPLYPLRVTNGASPVGQVSNLSPSRLACGLGVPVLSEAEGPTPAASLVSPPPLRGRAGVGGVAPRSIGINGQRFSFTGLDGKTRVFRIPLLGSPQIINASLACACAQLLGIRTSAIRSGLASARWPGRFHVIPGDPTIVLDCAHDGISAEALARDMRAAFPAADITLVLGISNDKDANAVIRPLSRIASRVITTRSSLPRATDPLVLARLVQRLPPGAGSHEAAVQRTRGPQTERVEAIAPVSEALRRALSLAQPVGRGFHAPPPPRSVILSPSASLRVNSAKSLSVVSSRPPTSGAGAHVILVTGSVYVVGEAMRFLRISPCDLPL